MKIGSLDLDTRFEYLVVYRDKRDDTVNTWTLGMAFKSNYKSMTSHDYIEILGVYKKLTDNELNSIVCI